MSQVRVLAGEFSGLGQIFAPTPALPNSYSGSSLRLKTTSQITGRTQRGINLPLGFVPPEFSSAGKQVIASGTVHTFNSSQLIIQLGTLIFELEFMSASDDKQPRMEAETDDQRRVKYKLYNFDNPLGAGLKEPIKIGRYHNKELYFLFRAYAFDRDSSKTVHYTFFVDPA